MTELTYEAKEAINQYVYKKMIPTGVIATLVSFAVGFVVNDWARGQAYTTALMEVSSQVSEISAELGEKKGQVSTILEEVKDTKREVSAALLEVQSDSDKVKNILSSSKTADDLVKVLSTDEDFTYAIVEQSHEKLEQLSGAMNKIDNRAKILNDQFLEFSEKFLVGRIDENGVKSGGGGFVAKRDGQGIYTITFDDGFSTVPIILVTSESARNYSDGTIVSIKHNTVTENGFSVSVTYGENNNYIDANWQFLAFVD